MNAVVTALYALCVVGIVVSNVMLVRNKQVAKYRGDLIKDVGDANIRDIHAIADLRVTLVVSRGRWDWFDATSYDDMMWRFWQRCDLFYPDREKVLATDWRPEK